MFRFCQYMRTCKVPCHCAITIFQRNHDLTLLPLPTMVKILRTINTVSTRACHKYDSCKIKAWKYKQSVNSQTNSCSVTQSNNLIFVLRPSGRAQTICNWISHAAIIKYDLVLYIVADGCADISAPFNTHVHRNGDKLTIYCNNTGDTRHLVCSGTQWIGEIINCTNGRFEFRQFWRAYLRYSWENCVTICNKR